MNRTDTAPRALKLLRKEYTARELSGKLGVPLTTARGVIQRLRLKGKLERRVDELGYVRWKAKAERIPEGDLSA